MKYEFLEHTADIKFKAYGKNLEETFENAALAFSSYITKNKKVKDEKQKEIEIEAEDKKELLYTFIDELIFLLDAEEFLTAKADVKISGTSLTATIYGDDSKIYSGLNHIKAATYSEMKIKEKPEFMIQVVLDV